MYSLSLVSRFLVPDMISISLSGSLVQFGSHSWALTCKSLLFHLFRCLSIPAIVMVHSCHSWIGLLNVLLCWQIAKYFLEPWKLDFKKEAMFVYNTNDKLTWEEIFPHSRQVDAYNYANFYVSAGDLNSGPLILWAISELLQKSLVPLKISCSHFYDKHLMIFGAKCENIPLCYKTHWLINIGIPLQVKECHLRFHLQETSCTFRT